MRTPLIDPIARRAANAFLRRVSLLTVGGAALATGPTNASIGVARKKPNCKKKAKQRCTNDVATCRTQVPVACDNDPTCIAQFNLCCDSCTADGFIRCALAANSMSQAVAAMLT